MFTGIRREALVLLMGDIAVLIFSLWATLLVRYTAFPEWPIFYTHLVPFSFLFVLSVTVFLIAGLYEKHTRLVKSRLPETVFYAQIANVAVGAIFFFLVPYFGIQPKTNLFIYLFLSTAFVSAWRLYVFPLFSVSTPTPALLVGTGDVAREVLEEVNGNTRYAMRFENFLECGDQSPQEVRIMLLESLKRHPVSFVVMPFSWLRSFNYSYLPEWDAVMLSETKFIDLGTLYEDLFDKVALPLLNQGWFLTVESQRPTALYDIFKRVTDIILSALALIVLSPVILTVILILILFGGGSPFIFQKRLGKDGREIFVIKFRTMLFDDGEDPEKKKKNRVTRFGAFLRKAQVDEFPQFWNVLRGDLSLIGPRPEIPRFVAEYAKVIPYYDMRHLINPGLSGWAQIKHASPPKLKLDVEATREKLSYDLYYLKHRSFMLDMAIALRTIKILISWASR